MGGGARRRVVPGRVLVLVPVDGDGVVAGAALPAAHARVRALHQQILGDRVAEEVGEAVDDDDIVAVGQHGVVPGRSSHDVVPFVRDQSPRREQELEECSCPLRWRDGG